MKWIATSVSSLAVAVALSCCATTPAPTADATPAPAPAPAAAADAAPAPVADANAIPDYIAAAAADPARGQDLQNDARRHGAELVAFSGVKPGDTVLELVPGSGYWSQVFSGIVGSRGKLYLADKGKKITVLELRGQAVHLNGNDLLAFEPSVRT